MYVLYEKRKWCSHLRNVHEPDDLAHLLLNWFDQTEVIAGLRVWVEEFEITKSTFRMRLCCKMVGLGVVKLRKI